MWVQDPDTYLAQLVPPQLTAHTNVHHQFKEAANNFHLISGNFCYQEHQIIGLDLEIVTKEVG